MRRLNTRAPRFAGLLALMLGAVALLAVSGVATAKDHGRDDNGHHHHHGRHHDDGRHNGRHFDMREAGTISTFDVTSGKLTIALLDGGTVTGLVTDNTRIECEGVNDRLTRRDHGGGDDNSGPGSGGSDNSGPGNSGGQSGDDNGGRGEAEPGDDHGGRGEPEPGDDNGGVNEPGDDNGGETPPVGTPGASCDVDSLVPGTVVGDAELRFENGSAVFTEIELGHHS